MKIITEHLAQIIAIIAAICLLITSIVFFKGPVGLFFENIIEKETSIGDKVFENLENVGMFEGEGGSGETTKPEKNEYGFYYNVPYVAEFNDGGYIFSTAIVFYEDGLYSPFNNNYFSDCPDSFFTQDLESFEYDENTNTATDNWGYDYTFSADGNSLILDSNGDWDLGDGSVWTATGIEHGVYYNHVYVSANGDTIVFENNNTALYNDSEVISDIEWFCKDHFASNAGCDILVSVDGEIVFIYDYKTGNETIFECVGPRLNTPSISITGSVLTITPVENATEYEVYNGDKLLTTTNKTTVELSTYLYMPNTYTVRVRAIATGYFSSEYSTEKYTLELAPGLYKTGSNYTVLLKDWDTLINENIITVNGSLLDGGPEQGLLDGDLLISDQVTKIEYDAFYGTPLTGVVIPNTIIDMYGFSTSIGSFANCKSLTKVIFEANFQLETLYATFHGCSSLESVEFGENCKINELYSTFAHCSNLKSIDIPNTVTDIKNFAFMNSGIETINIPSSVTNIYNQVFESCSNLTSVIFDEKIQLASMGDNVFASCERLTNITIPDGVQSIGNGAFADCTELASITIPDSMQSIGYGAFVSCEVLKSIKYGGTVKQWNNIKKDMSSNYKCPEITVTCINGSITIPAYGS